jgi:transcriptional regulator with XRE-family HTH domain
MIRPTQIRAARALLGLSQTDLAEMAKIGVATIRRIEGTEDEVSGTALTLVRIQRALEAKGVLFIDQDDKHGAGVRLKKPQR